MSEPIQTPPRQPSHAPQKRGTGDVIPFRPAANAAELHFPIFSWTMLEQQLEDLAVTPAQQALVQTLVSATRKQAAFKPAALVLREVLCIASVLMDENFHPEAQEGGMS